MIIDLNAHLGHFPFRQLRHNTASGLLTLMDRNGIDKAVVSSINSVFYRDAHVGNEELAAEVTGSNGRLIPLATINPCYAGWEHDMDQALNDWHMTGIRLAPQYHGYSLTDAHGQKVVAAAAERNAPVAISQRLEDRRQKHPFDVAKDLSLGEVITAAKPYPSLRWVFLNWLGISGESLIDAGMKDRVLIDLTRMDVVLQKSIPNLIQCLGVGALAFGTHIPFNYPGPSLVKLDILDVSPEERESVAWKNTATFLGIDDAK